jgi:cell division protein FtsI (penicillin-binding protein 3)
VPANRGRILDRNGLMLATSVPAPSIWAIPEDVDARTPQLGKLAKLLEMPLAELHKKLADEDKTFVWLKRQVDESVAKRSPRWTSRASTSARNTSASTPRARPPRMWWASPMWKTTGQEGRGAGLQQKAGRASWLAPRHQGPPGPRGRRRGRRHAAGRWPDMQLSIDSKVQFFAYQKLRDAVITHKAKAGSVVVLDAHRRGAGAGQLPQLRPHKRRQNLSGEQLRNRALTDTFEPGSTMKPITVAWRWSRAHQAPPSSTPRPGATAWGLHHQ